MPPARAADLLIMGGRGGGRTGGLYCLLPPSKTDFTLMVEGHRPHVHHRPGPCPKTGNGEGRELRGPRRGGPKGGQRRQRAALRQSPGVGANYRATVSRTCIRIRPRTAVLPAVQQTWTSHPGNGGGRGGGQGRGRPRNRTDKPNRHASSRNSAENQPTTLHEVINPRARTTASSSRVANAVGVSAEPSWFGLRPGGGGEWRASPSGVWVANQPMTPGGLFASTSTATRRKRPGLSGNCDACQASRIL